MKNLLFAFLIVVFLLFSSAAYADWDPGDQCKMTEPQLPDYEGTDVCLVCQMLADDFVCAETGLITDIHFWISWHHDDPGQVIEWQIQIVEDQGGMPALVGWTWSGAGNLVTRPYGSGLQDWLCPSNNYYVQGDHWNFYQVNITDIPDEEAFRQEEGRTYWLIIRAMTDLGEVGWKTSTDIPPAAGYGNRAMYFNQTMMQWDYIYTGTLQPVFHDLAFVITGHPEQPDELDFGDAPQDPYPTKIDKDGARHTIVQGVYLGASVDGDPDGQPDAACAGDDNDGNDDEDGVTQLAPLTPGLWDSLEITPSVDGYINAWIDFNGDGDWDDPGENIMTDYLVLGGAANQCSFWVPYYANPHSSAVSRFRYTTYPSAAVPMLYTGLATDGEVEDHMIDIGENPEIKWLQTPDRSKYGIDIKMDSSDGQQRHLADDFLCDSFGIITDIHLWCSWKNDIVGRIDNLKVKFYSDDPVGEGGSNLNNDYSMPDELLWEKVFDFDDIITYPDEIGYVPEGEAWWDPAREIYIDPGDYQIHKIDLYIPHFEAFRQQGSAEDPKIYWIEVSADTADGELGWKTRQYPDHLMDDAVFAQGSELPRIYEELQYPPEHAYHPNSIDLAFALTGRDLKKPVENLKWSQPPLEIEPMLEYPLYCGWNQTSITKGVEFWDTWPSVADDFRCLGSMPVTSIHFWGSFINWNSMDLPDLVPQEWLIRFWSDVPVNPDDPNSYSHPGLILHEFVVPADRVQTEWVGDDMYPDTPPETCFQHYIDLLPEEIFYQDDFNEFSPDNIYWLSIIAVYPEGTVTLNPWGWKTRPQHWNDDAVAWDCRYDPDTQQEVCKYYPIEDVRGNSMDVAFELDTDPNYIKWKQEFTGMRHWPHYEDERSMRFYPAIGSPRIYEVADDWLCTRRTPVNAIVWWGSYINHDYQPCQPTVPTEPTKPDYFKVLIYTDVPANHPDNPYGYSYPETVIWEYDAYNYDQVMVAYDKNPAYAQGQGGMYEPVYRYSVRLPQEHWFKQRKINQVYWVSIIAVYDQSVPTQEWGWTNHKHVYNDDAVAGYNDPTGIWRWDELYDDTGKSCDMSFVLFTDPATCVTCADYNFSGMVEFKDYAVLALDWLWSGQPGGYANGDLNCDGDVNMTDIKIFADQWLSSCP